MAIRKILVYGDEILRTPSKEVHKVSSKIKTLVKDLRDTMYSANGVGLAAPQIGENLRVFVIDVADEDAPPNPIVFINPKIIKKEGAVNSYEGCLSFPEAYTNVRRYANVKVKAMDSSGRSFVLEATDGSLLARAIQHEFDHLDGVLFVDHARNRFETDSVLKEHNLPPIQSEKLIDEPELEDQISKVQSQELPE
ncbi:MAG: peptide deformylase [Candidatus Gastranaerophilales bacterium]|nr:peptide deformylase [Candidatus Gastranaerophilales bacterium]